MKKLIAGLGIAALAGVFAPASAATINGVSDSSTATAIGTFLIDVLLVNNNKAEINNNISSNSNSGKNTFVSADDQTGTALTTGDAGAATLVENTANNNFVGEEYEAASTLGQDITDVSDSSTATVSQDDKLKNDVTNNNDVVVNNNIDADSDTGTNSVSSGDSLKDTTAITGKSSAATGVLNTLNTNLKDIKRMFE